MQNTILTNTVIVFRLYHAIKHDQREMIREMTQREEPNDSGHELLHVVKEEKRFTNFELLISNMNFGNTF